MKTTKGEGWWCLALHLNSSRSLLTGNKETGNESHNWEVEIIEY